MPVGGVVSIAMHLAVCNVHVIEEWHKVSIFENSRNFATLVVSP